MSQNNPTYSELLTSLDDDDSDLEITIPNSSPQTSGSSQSRNIKKISGAIKRRNAVIREAEPKGPRRKRKNESITSKEELRPIRIGDKIHFWENDTIGLGKTGVVLRGFFEDRSVPAAVKMMQKDKVQYYDNEIEILRTMVSRNKSVNIVRYFATEKDDKQYYIAMERAEKNLEEHIKNGSPETDEELISYMYQACKGLNEMHTGKRNQPIVHRDIKPNNMLLFPSDHEKSPYILKLTDFGISKILTSIQSQSTGTGGTYEWMSPSCLKALEENKDTAKASTRNDIFSLGMVIFYVMSRGVHPFGSEVRRPVNIVDGNHDFKALKNLKSFIYLNLVDSMLKMNPEDRPTIETVLKHPCFWTDKQKLDFVTTVCNSISSIRKMTKGDKCIQMIDCLVTKICNCQNELGWRNHLGPEVDKFLQKQQQERPKHFKKYNGMSVISLVEFIMDKFQHRSEWQDTLGRNKNVFGNNESTYIRFFTSRFPLLIPSMFTELQSLSISGEFSNHSDLQQYFDRHYYFKLKPYDCSLHADCGTAQTNGSSSK